MTAASTYSTTLPPWVRMVRTLKVAPYVTGGLWLSDRPGRFYSGGFCGWVTDQWLFKPGTEMEQAANDN